MFEMKWNEINFWQNIGKFEYDCQDEKYEIFLELENVKKVDNLDLEDL